MQGKMGRPKSDNPKRNNIRVRLDDETYAKISDYAKSRGITKADAMRQAIDNFLNPKQTMDI